VLKINVEDVSPTALVKASKVINTGCAWSACDEEGNIALYKRSAKKFDIWRTHGRW